MASDLPTTKSYARIPDVFELPNLIEVQAESFQRLKTEGLADLFDEISPIESYNKGMKLYFPGRTPEAQQWGLRYWFGEPKHSIEECVEKDLTFASPLYVSVLLAGPEVPEPIKQEIFLGDFPEMTEKGTFIVNGTERVVVSQLIRSPGVYFEAPVDRATGRRLAMAKLIPDRGAWMEFETRKNDYLILKFNRKRTVPITIFLRALAAVADGMAESPIKEGSDEELLGVIQRSRVARAHAPEEFQQGSLGNCQAFGQVPRGFLAQGGGDEQAVGVVVHILEQSDQLFIRAILERRIRQAIRNGRQGAQENRDRDGALAVELEDDVIGFAGFKLHPGAPVRDQLGHRQAPAGSAIDRRFEIDARGADQLRYHNTLGTVNDKSPLLGHFWEIPQENILFDRFGHFGSGQ